MPSPSSSSSSATSLSLPSSPTSTSRPANRLSSEETVLDRQLSSGNIVSDIQIDESINIIGDKRHVDDATNEQDDINIVCDSIDDENEEDDDDEEEGDDDDVEDEDEDDSEDGNNDETKSSRLETIRDRRPESRQPPRNFKHVIQTQSESQQQHPQSSYSNQNHTQLLMSALDKFDPDKNGLEIVPKEITSSTLTTRLKGVCKINRLIEHCNDLCHSFTEIGAQAKYRKSISRFRDWILQNKIIEHIFGPNCHVEIIKQSHTILNFVAYSLNNEHVNVIWSASLLKHCGRQVLDLLTSLIRFMRPGPVLHLYWLVKNLNIEDHSEHTLLLISHILRFIWSHSPCINQIQFCNLQKNRQQLNYANQSNIHDQNQRHKQEHNPLLDRQQEQSFTKQKHAQSQSDNPTHQSKDQHSLLKQAVQRPARGIDPSKLGTESLSSPMMQVTATASTTTSSVMPKKLDSSKSFRMANTEDHYQWLASCIFSNDKDGEVTRRPASTGSTTGSESTDLDKDLQQSLYEAIKGVSHQPQQNFRRISPGLANETIAKGGTDQEPADPVKQNVVDHILKSITSNPSQPSSQQKQSFTTIGGEQSNDRNQQSEYPAKQWVKQWKNSEFLDNTSDVSACCSEEKNMGDFDDDIHDYSQVDNSTELGDQVVASEHNEIFRQECEGNKDMLTEGDLNTNIEENIYNQNENLDNTSPSRDSETKFRSNFGHYQSQMPFESVSQFKELKKASYSLSSVTSEKTCDEDLKDLSEYNLGNLSDPGRTLLWDLLQDGTIEHLANNIHAEVENVLVNLVMSFGDRYIRYKFIEACLENLSVGTSVIISLRLLPKLMSFNTITRNLSIPAINETHTIVLWAEQEYSMSQNFFKNLVDYYSERQRLYSKLLYDKQLMGGSYECEELRQLEEYGELNPKNPIFSHIDKIITRMSFLTFIYSKPFSPEIMRLSKEQMDQLWDCLASDTNLRCSDVLFQWIYQQAVGDDFHGVNEDLLDYVLKIKMPTLKPEHFRLRGLKLLEQLLWIRQDYECCHGLEHPATKLLWDVALKAADDEVSMAAIRILNHFYIYTNHQKSTKCDKGINFMKYCMDHLESCLSCLTKPDNSINMNQLLDIMQKVILLIRTHLEVFKAHWSYYLRILQLNNEADLMSHRISAYEIKFTMTIRVVCQAASSMDKTTIEMQVGDFVGELRAEIVKWWYSQVDRTHYEHSSYSPSSTASSSSCFNISSSNAQQDSKEADRQQATPKLPPESNATSDSRSLNSFTEFLLANHHSLRLLSHNQEIPFEWDERQINELDFKDMQVIYILNDVKAPNLESVDDSASDKSNESSRISYMPKAEIPSLLLIRYEYFECLMEADRLLGCFQSDNLDLTNRAKTLSRRVWEIIQILPTCPHYKEDLKRCGSPNEVWRLKSVQCSNLLSAQCPQRLLYSLQIIDILRSSVENPQWGSIFIRKGGLADIFEVFMSQKLLPETDEDWNEWLQECLAYLLKLLFQFGTRTVQQIKSNDSSSSSTSSRLSVSTCSSRASVSSNNATRRPRRNRARLLALGEERMLIPLFSEELLKLLADTDLIFNRMIQILHSSAHCRSQSDQYYYVTMSSRAMIVHHVMSFLASWCKSDPKFPKFSVCDHEYLLKSLILDDTDTSIRREACNGFFKVHHACSTKITNLSVDSIKSTLNTSLDSPTEANAGQSDNQENWTFTVDLLKCLIKFLPITESMKPPKPIRNYVSENDYIKELNSPGCKDYFWLASRLIESLNSGQSADKQNISVNNINHPNQAQQSNDKAANCSISGDLSKIDLFDLCKYLVLAIRRRQTYETRDFSVEDDTLRGMLHMMVMALKRDPSFRYTNIAFEFVHELYEYLFAPPTQSQRYHPKCKSPSTRSTAFDLMIALVERCPKNYFGLLELLLIDQHNSVVKGPYPNDYWPHDDCRSDVGFVGLVNLGATCYLATCMQHLFMIPDLRYAILSIEDTKNIRHGDIIRELQKIFTFMLESERKAYNPRNFCKVYTMDNHPLNIAEQTDMTEFLTDLITKLEESSPELRHIIKGLFSGTLSNNVVSLDCPHISRTTEEFYTIRVQVADMRNLNDSLDELTVKDTLEGDNMYTCSTCEKKVRAEKRACIVKLPRILCFNTMRYTFNMATMTKEKVNTHFSFPLKLDMADYLETNLMKRQQSSSSSSCSSKQSPTEKSPEISKVNDEPDESSSGCTAGRIRTDSNSSGQSISGDKCQENSDTIYELIGVTVHTGNADGGHYYCFIRDCEDQSTDKQRWYLFNDAEVKPFDDSHIGTECYGGELTTKSYDAINDRFMDFSIEKTNSAYMLFYKRLDYKYHSRSVALRYLESDTQRSSLNLELASKMDLINPEACQLDANFNEMDMELDSNKSREGSATPSIEKQPVDLDQSQSHKVLSEFSELCQKTYEDFKLPKYLANWIWSDNMKFSRDKNVFEHNYYNFIWQICANLPKTLNQLPENVNLSDQTASSNLQASEDAIAIRTVHLAIAFVLGVLMNSRERPNLSNWTELIRKQFNSSKAACDWLMHLIDDEETWLKQLLLKCPIEMVRQLFQRLCNDLNGSKQHKKLRLIK